MDPRIGTELAGHRIESVIGRGGASVVYLAEHVRLGRKVALKVLAPHLADDADFRERFIRESRIAATVDHPNIVTIYDAGETVDLLYISMRYIEGSDLERVLRAEGSLERSRAIHLLSQVAAALDAAHGRGLVHRDVKPGNVLIETSEGGLERAYLADFGISKRATSGGGLTRTGQFVGTVDYVAPEQISGGPVDGRTDVYSLGCMLYRCLAGELPFHGDTDVATIYRHLNDPPPTYDEVGSTSGMDDVLARALAKSRGDRYATCSGLIEAARAALSDTRAAPTVTRAVSEGKVVAANDTRVDSGWHPPARRSRSIWLGAVGVGIAGIIAAVFLAWPREGAPPSGGPSVTGGGTTTTSGPSPPVRRQFLNWAVLKERSKEGGQSMDDVAATADGLVVVGHVEGLEGDDDGAVWLSTDVDRWRQSGSEVLGGTGNQRLLAVTEFQDLVVAGGWRDGAAGVHEGAVWISRDRGETWGAPSILEGDVAEVRGFTTLGATTLIAVGDIGPEGFEDAGVWTSPDGVDWTLVSDPDLRLEGDQEIWSVHASGDLVVAVGSSEGVDGTFDAAVWTSTNGTDWRRADPAMFEEPGNQLMKAAAGGVKGLPFVIVGCEDDEFLCDAEGHDSDAAVWISHDGETWDRVPLEDDGLVGDGIQTMVDVSREGDHFMAVGRVTANPGDLDGANWFSHDGLTWELQLRPSHTVALLGGEGNQAIRALARFRRPNLGLRFIAVGVTDVSDQDAVVWGGS